MHKLPAALAGLASTFAATAHAHGGHGMAQDTHWHATDAWGFLLVAVLAAIAIWFTRGGK